MILGTFFAADVFVKGFVPFVSYFVESNFSNPYQHFSALQTTSSFTGFPYPSLMLWIFAIPRVLFSFLFSSQHVVGFLDLFVYHIPILLADVAIYLVLSYWLQGKQRQVLWFYWASPILIYISYFHGQLDVIPMAGLFLSLLFLFRKNYVWSFALLGLSLAIKTHLFAAVPFYFLFAIVNRFPLRKIVLLFLLMFSVFFILIAPYLHSPAFISMVFRANPQNRIFLLGFPYNVGHLEVLLAPAAYFLILFRFFAYKRLTKDMFLLILGMAFCVLVILVPPMPGWFYWPLPFLAYFYIKARGVPVYHLWILIAFYFLYFFFRPDSDLLVSFSVVAPALAHLSSPYAYLAAHGFDADTVSNFFFTGMLGAMAMNIMWCYRVGIHNNFQYISSDQPVLIGVSGDSGAGKTTFYRSLEKLLGPKNTLCVDGDDTHKWGRGDNHWKTLTHLDPKANHIHQDLGNAQMLRSGIGIERSHYNHDTGMFTDAEKIKPRHFVVFVGLHTLYVEQMRRMFNFSIYLDTDESLRVYWKTRRDTGERGYTRDKVIDQLRHRQLDSERYIQSQRDYADLVIRYFCDTPVVEGGDAPLKLQIRLSNSIQLDPILQALSGHDGLRVIHTYDSDVRHQYLEFDGQVRSAVIRDISYALIPNIPELLFEYEPDWEDDYKGLCQLVVLYYFSEISHLPNYEKNRF